MFNGDPRKMSTDEARKLLGSAGWLVIPAYERLQVSKGKQAWQLAYSAPMNLAVYAEDVASLLAGDANKAAAAVVHLSVVQRAEVFAQYHDDTHILHELGITVSERTIEGHPDKLRELAKLIAQDYDRETGFETVSAPLKRSMLNAAERIVRQVSA